MARKAGSIPAVPPAATGELYSFLQAVRQSLLRAEELLNITEAALEAQLAELEGTAATATDLTALTTRVTTAESEINTLQSELNTAEANILLRADKDQTIAIPIYIEYPTVNEHLFFIDSPYAITITKVTARLSGGTATIAIQPNNVAMNTGAMAVTTTQASESPTSSNTIAVGGDLYLDISAASATASELKIMIYGTIVLA
jgi:hypothetical protein